LSKNILAFKLTIEPNPHCFKTITKAMVCGCQEPLPPHPPNSKVGGKVDVFSENCFNKCELHLHYHQKHIENYIFDANFL
jgi:hypothetical protein